MTIDYDKMKAKMKKTNRGNSICKKGKKLIGSNKLENMIEG